MTKEQKIAARIRTAAEKCKGARDAWVDGTLDLAKALKEGRDMVAGDLEFGHWLRDQGIGLEKDERAALLGMTLDLALSRRVLQTTSSWSWRLIWRDQIQEHVRSRSAAKAERRGERSREPRLLKTVADAAAEPAGATVYQLPRAAAPSPQPRSVITRTMEIGAMFSRVNAALIDLSRAPAAELYDEMGPGDQADCRHIWGAHLAKVQALLNDYAEVLKRSDHRSVIKEA
jgi:hypothetical protein